MVGYTRYEHYTMTSNITMSCRLNWTLSTQRHSLYEWTTTPPTQRYDRLIPANHDHQNSQQLCWRHIVVSESSRPATFAELSWWWGRRHDSLKARIEQYMEPCEIEGTSWKCMRDSFQMWLSSSKQSCQLLSRIMCGSRTQYETHHQPYLSKMILVEKLIV